MGQGYIRCSWHRWSKAGLVQGLRKTSVSADITDVLGLGGLETCGYWACTWARAWGTWGKVNMPLRVGRETERSLQTYPAS